MIKLQELRRQIRSYRTPKSLHTFHTDSDSLGTSASSPGVSTTTLNTDRSTIMKFFSTILLVIPAATAWNLRLYRYPNFRELLEDRSGSGDLSCTNLVAFARNRPTSVKWDGRRRWRDDCNVKLFSATGCNSGDQLFNLEGLKEIDKFTGTTNNQIESFKVEC